MKVIYENNKVSIEIEVLDEYEYKVNCNGKNLIVIEAEKAKQFEHELSDLLDKYRI